VRIYPALGLLFVSGGILFVSLSSQPRFRDAASWPWVTDGDSPAFFAAADRNRTVDGQIADVGVGLASLALSLALGAAALRAHSWGALRALVTPSRKWAIVVFANVSLLALFYGEWLAVVRDYLRGENPPWADTLAIPMMWFISGWTVAALILTLGLTVCLWRARLPAPLWQRPVGWWPWASTLVLCLPVAFEALSLADAVRFGKAFAVAGHVEVLYWLLCGRAAASSRHAA
jgi:hypothetical protein